MASSESAHPSVKGLVCIALAMMVNINCGLPGTLRRVRMINVLRSAWRENALCTCLPRH
jgi:hypothetical protein